MTSIRVERRRHFVLQGFTETQVYIPPPQGGGSRDEIPQLDRVPHGGGLRSQIDEVRAQSAAAAAAQRDAGISEGLGIPVEFEGFPDLELAFQRLSREPSGIELLNVRVEGLTGEGGVTRATVFVPDGKLDHFERLIRGYLERKEDIRGRPRDNQPLIDTIRSIRAASLRALWTGSDEFPSVREGPLWWEVWLPVRSDREGVLSTFRERVDAIQEGITGSSGVVEEWGERPFGPEMRVSQGELRFPERSVVLVYATVSQMEQSMPVLNSIAELRRAGETADFFVSSPTIEQEDWLDDLLKRSKYTGPGNGVPYVCILDTGVNRGHRLIAPALAPDDLHSGEPGWGSADSNGHGTGMAGLALAGDLTDLVLGSGVVYHKHRLESVKLLPEPGANGNEPQFLGRLMEQAIYRPEITAPSRLRVFGMAITSRANRDRGRPSAWSAAIDSLAADEPEGGENPRLIIVSAGNVEGDDSWSAYPDSNTTDSVHDPAQAWNALTVGAYTELVDIADDRAEEFSAIAPKGGLSPFSTTSLVWDRKWPLKPDVVLEGGNAALDPDGAATTVDSLCLLTSYHLPDIRPFSVFNATSAATALAARLAAQVMAEYSHLWPETVRALIVHSSEWTEAMKRAWLPQNRRARKQDYGRLIQSCGFGVPDLDRALWSVANSLTMVLQERLQPFKKEGSGGPTYRDMHIHGLPWPDGVLESLGETLVEMRVTISYFIEPNPSARGTGSRYRYESHGLRFDVKRPYETVDQFRARINAAARDEEGGQRPRSDGDAAWLIGKQERNRGSLHSDTWRGTAVDLASIGHIAVYPTSGWWRSRPAQKRFDSVARYSLVVSIRAPKTDVDLYNEVQNKVLASVEVGT